MECSCSCDIGEGEQASVYDVKMPKARKQHKCSECRRVIRPGEKYEYVRAKWDDGFEVIKTCAQCAAIRRDFGCGSHGTLREDVWECLGVDIVNGAIRDGSDWWVPYS